MARIYKCTDKLPIKIHDFEVAISPLTFEAKSICQSLLLEGKPMDAAVQALRHSLKDIKGVENADGSKYELEIENNVVSQASIDDVLNLEHSPELQIVAISLINGIPKQFNDPTTGKALEGVRFIKRKKS